MPHPSILNPWTRNSLPVLSYYYEITFEWCFCDTGCCVQDVPSVVQLWKHWMIVGTHASKCLPIHHINLRPCMYQHHNKHNDLCYSCMTVSLLQTISHDWQPSLYWFLNGCCFCRSTTTHCHPTTDFISTKPNSCFGLCGEQSTALQCHMD